MPYDPNRHHRRSIRLRGYDYSQAGAYFVTICTQDRHPLFGGIEGGEMRLNDAGRMVEYWWGELNRKFLHVTTDAFVVMPDHIHGIIMIVAPRDAGGDTGDDSIEHSGDTHADHAVDAGPMVSLSQIVQWFKIMTTTDYIRHVKQSGWPPFNKRVWQRNYYERIVRDDQALANIRRYIAANPARWAAGRDDLAALLARMEAKE